MNKTLYISFAIFMILLVLLTNNLGIESLDIHVNDSLRATWNKNLDSVIIGITDFGSVTSVVLSFLITMVYYAYKKEAIFIRFYLSAMFGAILLFGIIKDVVSRDRPETRMFDQPEFSFPSGHATIATVLAWFVYFAMRTRIGPSMRRWLILICITYPILMSFTRIYLNVHYLSDVLAGMALGTAWMALLSHFYIREVNGEEKLRV